ncbi:putative zinc finger/helix-turn-helix protein, YgiT family [Serratia ficaria]|uniref:helix-turn-helix domain-containing protein n=1 Tax=Serratia ficaria TaxID=61651 RepID=UPI00217721E1|nr:helix-turn-helix transcriptional regulator [Serratia ficaria]CAI1110719.1 putative zinc finger/helix-turn-helix protein, YgiT family [Serratia ficaria]CAI1813634.1 putative zinc finger/helix-turn-helix protein, YgiT family [Serratia ficaria]CAI2468189.1 putative zinc finger/helix-turn-helix protein, YgiT family [Serratia ficaria]CAI2489000.1 putative zinc finger/helix-turn-helix protein, YgiT family [Serratia ficaria]CAI2791651.1 putative zinc finger/helix-turn-helix protein, YgiT family [S
MNMSEKVKAIRVAEGLTQMNFCKITGIALSTLKNYEGGHSEPSLSNMLLITNKPQFLKYTLWLMTDKTSPESGQIAPGCAHSGQENKESDHSERNIG